MVIMNVRIMFYSSKWSWKIVDYEYRPQTPYFAPTSEIFPLLWNEKFSYGKSYAKNTCLLLDGNINIQTHVVSALWRQNNKAHLGSLHKYLENIFFLLQCQYGWHLVVCEVKNSDAGWQNFSTRPVILLLSGGFQRGNFHFNMLITFL